VGAHHGAVEHLHHLRRAAALGEHGEERLAHTPARSAERTAFHTLFHGPNRFGRTRQVMLWPAKKRSASGNSRSSLPFAPGAGRQARNTSTASAKSRSVILVDIANPPKVGSP
jgi:hypothetical protein